MKIDKNKFVTLLERIAPLNSINESVLIFNEEGLSATSACLMTRSLVSKCSLGINNFEEYSPLGEVAIRSILTISKMISSLSGDKINIKLDENKQYLIFTDENNNKEIKCILPSLNTIGRVPNVKDISYPISICLSDTQNFLNIKKNFESVSSSSFIFNFKGKKLNINTSSVSGDLSISEEFIFPNNDFEETTTSVGKNLINALNKISSDSIVNIYTGNKLPIKIIIEDFMKTEYLIATSN